MYGSTDIDQLIVPEKSQTLIQSYKKSGSSYVYTDIDPYWAIKVTGGDPEGIYEYEYQCYYTDPGKSGWQQIGGVWHDTKTDPYSGSDTISDDGLWHIYKTYLPKRGYSIKIVIVHDGKEVACKQAKV